MNLTEETFRALARSSPWRWRSVHLVREVGGPVSKGGVEAWIRRPGLMRVVADGEVHVVREAPDRVVRYAEEGSPMAGPVELPRAGAIEPESDSDGFVAIRPADAVVSLGDPMWQSYDWVAMLDPVELGDGSAWRDPDTGADIEAQCPAVEPYPGLDWPTTVPNPGTVLSALRQADHRGRPTWWATAVPTRAYEPRCSCCPLLHSEVADWLEYDTEDAPFVPTVEYPQAHEVALDVETGICVAIRAIGSPTPGVVHDVRIIAVDEDYGDELFVEPRRSLWRRR